VPRDRLEAVPRQLARREVVADHGVHRVDQLAPRRQEPHPPPLVAARGPAPGGALAQPQPRHAPQRERHAQPARPLREEGEVEAVQVVVLDDVRVRRGYDLHQPPDQPRLARVAVALRLQQIDLAARPAHGDEEDAIAAGIEPGRLQVELEPPELVKDEAAKVRPPRRYQVLLLRREGEHGSGAQRAQVGHALAEAAAGAVENRPRQLRPVVRRNEEAQLAGPVQLAIPDARAGAPLGP
jgi:hypothetical protein